MLNLSINFQNIWPYSGRQGFRNTFPPQPPASQPFCTSRWHPGGTETAIALLSHHRSFKKYLSRPQGHDAILAGFILEAGDRACNQGIQMKDPLLSSFCKLLWSWIYSSNLCGLFLHFLLCSMSPCPPSVVGASLHPWGFIPGLCIWRCMSSNCALLQEREHFRIPQKACWDFDRRALNL